MSQVVKADVWQSRLLEEQLQAAPVYVGGFERGADLQREYKSPILIQRPGLQPRLCLKSAKGCLLTFPCSVFTTVPPRTSSKLDRMPCDAPPTIRSETECQDQSSSTTGRPLTARR